MPRYLSENMLIFAVLHCAREVMGVPEHSVIGAQAFGAQLPAWRENWSA